MFPTYVKLAHKFYSASLPGNFMCSGSVKMLRINVILQPVL